MYPIDHVEVFVPDRREAAEWYREILGLTVLPDLEFWADDPGGPLMLSGDGGRTKLALFQSGHGDRQGATGFHQLAFEASGPQFLEFVTRAEVAGLQDRHGNAVTRGAVSDHARAFSIYFCDPWGHRLEVTTYDYEHVQARLGEEKASY